MNVVVSYNIRAIREKRGLTQQDVAEHLERLTGHRPPQASISAMERAFDGPRRRRFDSHELYRLAVVFDVPRRRRFDSHELYRLAVVFDVPIIYFLLPPAGSELPELANTQRPVVDLCIALLGYDHQLGALRDRLAEISHHDSHHTVLYPLEPTARWHSIHSWRATRIDVPASGLPDRLQTVARVLTDFAAKIATGGLSAHLGSPLHPGGASRSPVGREGDPRS